MGKSEPSKGSRLLPESLCAGRGPLQPKLHHQRMAHHHTPVALEVRWGVAAQWKHRAEFDRRAVRVGSENGVELHSEKRFQQRQAIGLVLREYSK